MPVRSSSMRRKPTARCAADFVAPAEKLSAPKTIPLNMTCRAAPQVAWGVRDEFPHRSPRSSMPWDACGRLFCWNRTVRMSAGAKQQGEVGSAAFQNG